MSIEMALSPQPVTTHVCSDVPVLLAAVQSAAASSSLTWVAGRFAVILQLNCSV